MEINKFRCGYCGCIYTHENHDLCPKRSGLPHAMGQEGTIKDNLEFNDGINDIMKWARKDIIRQAEQRSIDMNPDKELKLPGENWKIVKRVEKSE